MGTMVSSIIAVQNSDVTRSAMASQITGVSIVNSTVYSGADQSKHQSSASLAFVWGIHRGPVKSPHKGPVTRKMFPFDDVIIKWWRLSLVRCQATMKTNVDCHLDPKFRDICIKIQKYPKRKCISNVVWKIAAILSRLDVLKRYLFYNCFWRVWRAKVIGSPLQWRHNEHDCVSNHQPCDCLLNRIFKRRSKKTSKLGVTTFVRGIHRSPVNSPHKGPVTRKMFPFDDVIIP